jgi:hypothetical protein
LLIDYEEVTEAYMEVARAGATSVAPIAGYDSGKGGKGGKKRLASPIRGAAIGAIGARRTSCSDSSAGGGARRTSGFQGSAGGSATGIGTPAERLSDVLLAGGEVAGGEDPGLDCRAIIHIVKHCHSNIIDISFVWHCL